MHSIMRVGGSNKSGGTAGAGSAGTTTSSSSATHFTRVLSSNALLFTAGMHRRNMDASKFVLCFLILFNVPSLDRGTGFVPNVVSGTIISISTSKGTVIMDKSGASISTITHTAPNPAEGPATNHRKWNHYQTALSNTGPLLEGSSSTTTTTITAKTSSPPDPTTTLPTTLVSSAVSSMEVSLASGNQTSQKPSRLSNKTYHISLNSNNKELLNNARKYIASYEDLQSRFPDGSPFENNTSINMTVPLGDTAFLRCRVRNLGERSISWIRRRDWHILTTGKTTYTNDERFNVLHVDGTEDWTLQIKFVQKRDNGSYECQVSTGTGIISYFVNLFIAVPEAFILGNGEYHVEQGSTINLVCVIEKSPKPPEFIFWYHNELMINYGSTREVVVRTEPGARTHSRLTIRDAMTSDSGNYTCKTAHADPASIYVYVSQASGLFSGDKMAAIQRRKTTDTSNISPSTSSGSSSPAAASSASSSSSSSDASSAAEAAAASVLLTAATTLPTAAALLSLSSFASLKISSIQLTSALGYFLFSSSNSKSNKSGGGGGGGRGTCCGSKINSAANFLLSLSLVLGVTVGDVVVTTLQLLLSLLFLPALLIFTAGVHFLRCGLFSGKKVEPLLLLPYHNNRRPNHHDHHHHHHSINYCSSANNLCLSLHNSPEDEQQQLLLHHKEEQHEQQCKYDRCGWWRWMWSHQQKKRHFVIDEEPLQLLQLSTERKSPQSQRPPFPSSSSMSKSLPVFLSIAQSLWSPFSFGFSTFSTPVARAMFHLLFLEPGTEPAVVDVEVANKRKQRESKQPLFVFHPPNRLGFRPISHLLIFPPLSLHQLFFSYNPHP